MSIYPTPLSTTQHHLTHLTTTTTSPPQVPKVVDINIALDGNPSIFSPIVNASY